MKNSELTAFKNSRATAIKNSRRVTPLIRVVSLKTLPDPLLVYEAILQDTKLPAFLMESVTHEEGKGDQSFICLLGKTLCIAKTMKSSRSIKRALRRASPMPHDTLAFVGGGGGIIGYEIASSIEKTVKPHSVDPFKLPVIALYRFSLVIALDHKTNTLYYIANVPTAYTAERGYAEGCRLIRQMELYVANSALVQNKKDTVRLNDISPNITDDEYMKMVAKAKQYIEQGDIFQVVLSRCFSVPFCGDGTSFYRALRANNPSPYLFHMRLCDACRNAILVGSSPEIMANIQKGKIVVRPLAGTRGRGKTPAGDKRKEHALLNSKKECAEHGMLVDLALHDVRGLCETGSTKVVKLMELEKFKTLIHMASEINGTLRKNVHPFDACIRVSPAGTLSGCPKIRAQQIIAELEPCQRGPYGGMIGWFTDYSARTGIFIRSALILKGKLYFQVGCGIVSDSEPKAELAETGIKARGTLRSLKEL